MITISRFSISIQILILSLFLTTTILAYSPQLQKSYFFIAPGNKFSYEFFQTRNGTIGHYFLNAEQSERYVLFDIASGDATPILEEIATACQAAPSIFQHLHYHIKTDSLLYYCASNSSLLFINQANHTVQNSIPFKFNGTTWPIAKLSTDGMTVNIFATNSLYPSALRTSILVKFDMQSNQVVSYTLFNQNLAEGEAVIAFTTGNRDSYIATNIYNSQNNFTTKIYGIKMIGNSYQLTPVANFTSSGKTITKLFSIGTSVEFNIDSTLYFIDPSKKIQRSYSIQTKQAIYDFSNPAVVLSADGLTLYFQDNTLAVYKLNAVYYTNLGTFKDFQILYGNQTSHYLMFTSDPSGLFFRIIDMPTGNIVRSVATTHIDLMLTDSTYTVVQSEAATTTFYIFNLKTDNLIMQAIIFSSKYYYNKDQHIVTSLGFPSCQVTHLDLVSGKSWTTLTFAPNVCLSFFSAASNVLSARITEKGNPELVISANQSYFIVSETYGQVIFPTSSKTHETEGINVNFDDLSLYFYESKQETTQINASFYTFNPQTKTFQLNANTLLNGKPVKVNGFFPMNQNETLALSDSIDTLINHLDSEASALDNNDNNLATGFKDNLGVQYVLLSHFSGDPQDIRGTGPILFSNDGKYASLPNRRDTIYSAMAIGPKSLAVFESVYSSVGVVKLYSADPQSEKTFISM